MEDCEVPNKHDRELLRKLKKDLALSTTRQAKLEDLRATQLHLLNEAAHIQKENRQLYEELKRVERSLQASKDRFRLEKESVVEEYLKSYEIEDVKLNVME